MKAWGVLGFVVSAVAFAGCSSAASAYRQGVPLAPAEAGAGAVKEIRLDDDAIEASFQKKEQMVFPMKLAVVGFERNPNGIFEDVGTDEFEKALAADAQTFRDVFPLFDFLPNPGEKALDVLVLRRAAARGHADAIILYDQRVDIRQRANAWALLNLTIVGAFFAPGADFEVAIDTRVRLVDVRNGVVYTALRDVREAEASSTTGGAERAAKALKKRLRSEAFQAIRERLKEKTERYRGGAKP